MSSAHDNIDVPQVMETFINNLANLTNWEQSFAISLLDQLSYLSLSDKRLWALMLLPIRASIIARPNGSGRSDHKAEQELERSDGPGKE